MCLSSDKLTLSIEKDWTLRYSGIGSKIIHMTSQTPTTGDRRAPRYDGVENRRRALEAALDVFSQLGYEAASTRMIAARAGIEQGHLAYYFPSKMNLWKQVVETFAQAAEQRLREQLALHGETDAATTARAVLPLFLRSLADNPRLTRLMLQEFSVSSERSAWLAEHFAKPVWSLLAPLFMRLQRDGHFPGTPPEIAYFSLVGSALITFGNRDLIEQFSGADTGSADWIDAAIAHMLRDF